MEADRSIIEKVLALIPQQAPFRFIDDIVEIDEDHVIGTYRFREDECFYRGHFPQRPVTPGVILLETMAQTGIVALGIYLLLKEGNSPEEISRMGTLFATADGVEFDHPVFPGERVVVRGRKVYMRRGSLKADITLEKEEGQIVCSGTLAGKGVSFDE